MPATPYTTVPGRIKALMEKIRTVGVPDKTSRNWLMLIGFKSSNDRTMLSVLKFIGFINQNGKPTDTWRAYRGPDHATVLAGALKQSYERLFECFEAPCKLTTGELMDFFKGESGSAEGTVSKMVDTFKALCSLADFRTTPARTTGSGPNVTVGTVDRNGDINGTKPVNININIELPLTDDDEVYARILKAIRKYLLD